MKISNVSNLECINLKLTSGKNKNRVNENKTNQIKEISNVFYKPLSFGRAWSEHKSWGAMIDPDTKEASFKIFTFPDTQRVTVTVEKPEEEQKEYELENKGSGVYEIKNIPAGEVEHGDKYYYTLYKPNQAPLQVKDPYSFRQEDFMGKSTVYDHSLYKWDDENWQYNKKRISRLAGNKNKFLPLNNAKIYEFNTASFSQAGTFEGAKSKLEDIKKLGFNSIEIMPVENTFSFNWGYDGVDKMAPSEHLGGPDGLKDLINAAHNTGLNVIMDMVPNHLGPDGAQLGVTGPYISHGNEFGDAFNFEKNNSRYVRDYIVNAALNWLDNYHCDGLRLDMTKYMESDFTMKQIAAEINYHKPEAFIIAEDSRNDERVTKPLAPEEYGKYQDESDHVAAIERISNNQTSINNLGFDSEWDFNYFHSLQDLLYGDAAFQTFETACANSEGKVKYVMSHDEIGNYDGARLISKLMVPMLNLNDNIELNEEDINRAQKLSVHKGKSYDDSLFTVRCQKAQLTAEKLANLLQTGKLNKYQNKDYHVFADEVLIPLGIKYNSNLYFDRIKHVFDIAFEKNKSAEVLTYSIPGPKMVFQGDEKADLTPFRFFRELDLVKDEQYLYWEKGYPYGKEALEVSKLGNIEYSKNGIAKHNGFELLIKDLNKIMSNNSAMTKGKIVRDNTQKHFDSGVMGLHTRDEESGNELYTVTNISNNRYPDGHGGGKYYIHFPYGQWVELINTNDKKYSGNGKFMNDETLTPDKNGQCAINLNTHSSIIFKRIS